MYSPRRRYRHYNSKKYYRNHLFAPSLRKAPAPNYYQMKGRILQQSPRIIKEPPTEVITRSKLDKMYETLKLYKYQFPDPPVPPVPPTPFDPSDYILYSVSGQYDLALLGDSFTFSLSSFQDIVDQIQKPDPPAGYHYLFDVINILFSCANIPNPDDSRFNLIWQSPLLTGGSQEIISKTVTTVSLSPVVTTIQCVPYNTGSCFLTKITVGSSQFQYNSLNKNTTDLNIDENGYYSFITSDSTSDTYGSSLIYTSTVRSQYQNSYFLKFKILLYLGPN